MNILQGQVGQIIAHPTCDDPTDSYFQAAFDFLDLLCSGSTFPPSGHCADQRLVLSVCVMSFLSLESAINRVFYDIFKAPAPFSRSIRPPVPAAWIAFIKTSWERLPIRAKYLLLPPLTSEFEFDEGSHTFRLFSEFLRFRNRLVHARQTTVTHTIRVTDVQEGQLGGDVLETSIESPDGLFPLTDFSASFHALCRADAEKALEIAYRMRTVLGRELLAAPMTIWRQSKSGGPEVVMTDNKIRQMLTRLFPFRFGPLE